MYYSQLQSNINYNMNTGNISTDDFLAIFSSTSPTDVAGGGPGGGGGTGGGNITNISNSSSSSTNPNTNITGKFDNNLINNIASNITSFASNSSISNISTTSSTSTFTPTTVPPIAATLNPPLLTIDGQYNLANFSNILETTTQSFNSINDSFLFVGNNYNGSAINLLSPYVIGGGGGGGVGSFYNNNFVNGSNVTEIHFPGPYPSGYTLTHIVIASIIVTILMIIIVVGNMLVIIAIATEKSLKNIQNWFIASLAVADFFLGLVIMPFSLANELMGYWIFGSWWCDIHSAMDVLLCTASIMNLCLISLDRYWSITKAVEYLKSRTPARAAFMIAAVWIMSALICIPPLLGWKVKMPGGPLPKCELSEDIGYVLYSALGSFYIPSCIMVFVYIRIYFAAKARARRGIKKHPRKANNEQVTSFTTAGNKGTIPIPSSSGAAAALQMHQQRQIATIETPPNNSALPMQIPTVTCDLASDISTSEAGEMEPPPPHPLVYSNSNSGVATVAGTLSPGDVNCKETLKVSTIATTHNALNAAAASLPPTLNINNNNNNMGNAATDGSATTTLSTLAPTSAAATAGAPNELRVVSPIAGRCRALSVGIDTDMVSEFDPSSSDSGVVSRCAVVKPLKFRLCQPIFGKKSSSSSSNQQQRRNESKAAAAAKVAVKPSEVQAQNATELEPAIPKVQKPRDPDKEKRRIARKKEKRATLILGLIMGSFIASWLPFFFLYILKPACNTHCHIPDSAFAIAFWLGYMNSALNPAIYTIFNKDFRRAFRRILFK